MNSEVLNMNVLNVRPMTGSHPLTPPLSFVVSISAVHLKSGRKYSETRLNMVRSGRIFLTVKILSVARPEIFILHDGNV